ncbi:MAG: AAA family ATPase, partial [Candidatus Zixiibacteriota bacterium]
ISQALERQGIKPEAYALACNLEREFADRKEARLSTTDWNNWKRTPALGEQWIYGYTPRLDRYVRDFTAFDGTEYAHRIPFGRETIMERLLLALGRPSGNSVMLIGEPGIGKKTIVHVLAKKIREQELTDSSLTKFRVLTLDVGQVLSDGQATNNDPKDWLRTILSEAVIAGNIILVVENIDLYLNPNGDYRMGEIFHEFLELPSSRIIGLTTPAAFHELTRLQVSVLKYFEAIQLEEPLPESLRSILINYFEPLEKKRVVFTLDALDEIIRAAERYNWETPFPERAIDLAEETLLFWERNPIRPFVDVSVVNAFLSLKSGVPLGEVGEEEKNKLLNLEERLHERIIGQHEAVRQLAEAFRKARTGLGNDKRPVGSFLFLGPTGVGKTETAKALAAVYFGNEEKMVRLDMSEFQTADAIRDLIGWTEGDDTPGRLTNLVQEHPFSILLLDEVEKAHPQVLDLFLQILDEGFVTDAFGHRVSFRNLIIIATSNAGAAAIHQATAAGHSMQDLEKELIQSIINERTFRPEFLNRFDGVILFNALTMDEIAEVTMLKLQAFAASLKASKNISITFPPDVVLAIATNGYDPAFGVRSINRYIADVVEDRLVKKLLTG